MPVNQATQPIDAYLVLLFHFNLVYDVVGEVMFRFCFPLLCCLVSAFTIVGCGGSGDSSGTNTFADMSAEDWEEYNAEQAQIAEEAEQAMKER
ncbi:hypothetical protein [Neorhodopirellula lusitana]|uniref:hypothetical protein n=1 Tax=Neorhodopirellula lusitana TaxID=445327 RepID=UPI0024B64FE3|nr:hypothetical protein [Neorhodopirellula lusitana]